MKTAFLLAMAGLLWAMSGEAQIDAAGDYLLYASEPFVVFEGLNNEREVGELVIEIDKDGHYVLREGVVHGACESEVAELKAQIAVLEKQVRQLQQSLFKPGSCYWDGCNWICCDATGYCSSTSMACVAR